MNARHLRRRLRRRAPASGRAAVSLLAFAALVVSVLVAGFGATAPKASAATCGTTNVALNKTATASSTENAGTPASAAVDGNTTTRWSSAFSDPQWLEVDLGSSQSICGVTLNWEAAYATAFQIQVSTDNANWTSIYSTTTGTGGVQNLTGLSGTGRYIRMYGTARATQYGYSIWEFQVFATERRAAVPAAPTERRAEQDRDRLLDGERGHPGQRPRCDGSTSTAMVESRSPTRSGSRSTSAPSQSICR